MLKRINLTGNPNLGVYISVNDEVAIVPFNLPTEMEPVMKCCKAPWKIYCSRKYSCSK